MVLVSWTALRRVLLLYQGVEEETQLILQALELEGAQTERPQEVWAPGTCLECGWLGTWTWVSFWPGCLSGTFQYSPSELQKAWGCEVGMNYGDYRKTGWTTRSEQARRQHSFMASASAPASGFPSWVPALTSWMMEEGFLSTSTPILLLVMDLIRAITTLTETLGIGLQKVFEGVLQASRRRWFCL